MKTKNTYPPTYTRALLTSSIAPATRRRVTRADASSMRSLVFSCDSSPDHNWSMSPLSQRREDLKTFTTMCRQTSTLCGSRAAHRHR